jgi:putative DNA primase/helicase
VFVAYHAAGNSTGFRLPKAWQTTAPNPRYVEAWEPGMALCAVMGHGLDLVDIDPRNGADTSLDWLRDNLPHVYYTALTPSGGIHAFVKSLGVRSRDNVAPGIDIKAGVDGVGHGFAFIAPTIRKSKDDGMDRAYQWLRLDDDELEENRRRYPSDRSGEVLAEIVRNIHAGYPATAVPTGPRAGRPWADIHATLAEGRHSGVHRLASALRGQGGWTTDSAIEHMYATVWPLIDQSQGGHPYSMQEFEADIADVFRRYDDGTTVARGADAERYFDPVTGLLVQTLADDILSLGPLAMGRDNISCDPVSEVINFHNGLYYWQDDAMRAHRPEVMSTVQLSVDYDPDATCPAFERFLAEVVPADMIPLMWELIGYLMYSGNPLHKAVMLSGAGRNGKGTFLRVMTALLGQSNITSVSLHDLVNTRFSTASLFGKIANIAGDIDGGYIENTATFKAITGQDMISAEHKGRDRFDYRAWAVPVFSANKVPPAADVTVGYLSRWLVIPFPNDFTGREDRDLDARLTTGPELRGIAAKAMEPLRRLLARGRFELPESGQQAEEEFVRKVDQVRAWLEDCCDLNPAHLFTPRTPLYNHYRAWAMDTGHRAVKASEFYDRIEAAGAVPLKVQGREVMPGCGSGAGNGLGGR